MPRRRGICLETGMNMIFDFLMGLVIGGLGVIVGIMSLRDKTRTGCLHEPRGQCRAARGVTFSAPRHGAPS
jgi:hypothetical protein